MKRQEFLKKTVGGILFVLVVSATTGCDKDGYVNKARLETLNSESVEVSVKEIIEIKNSDDTKFKKEYVSATINIIDKVESISENNECIENKKSVCNKIYFENGWVLSIEKTVDISNIQVGDELNVISTLKSTDDDTVIIENLVSRLSLDRRDERVNVYIDESIVKNLSQNQNEEKEYAQEYKELIEKIKVDPLVYKKDDESMTISFDEKNHAIMFKYYTSDEENKEPTTMEFTLDAYDATSSGILKTIAEKEGREQPIYVTTSSLSKSFARENLFIDEINGITDDGLVFHQLALRNVLQRVGAAALKEVNLSWKDLGFNSDF